MSRNVLNRGWSRRSSVRLVTSTVAGRSQYRLPSTATIEGQKLDRLAMNSSTAGVATCARARPGQTAALRYNGSRGPGRPSTDLMRAHHKDLEQRRSCVVARAADAGEEPRQVHEHGEFQLRHRIVRGNCRRRCRRAGGLSGEHVASAARRPLQSACLPASLLLDFSAKNSASSSGASRRRLQISNMRLTSSWSSLRHPHTAPTHSGRLLSGHRGTPRPRLRGSTVRLRLLGAGGPAREAALQQLEDPRPDAGLLQEPLVQVADQPVEQHSHCADGQRPNRSKAGRGRLRVSARQPESAAPSSAEDAPSRSMPLG